MGNGPVLWLRVASTHTHVHDARTFTHGYMRLRLRVVCVCVLSFCCCCVASWASPKHDLRGSACSCACVCTARAASTSFTIWEVACCTWYVCVCVSQTERSLPVPLVWDGGRAMEAWYVCVCVSRTERSLPMPLVWDGGRAMEEGVGVAPPCLRSARRCRANPNCFSLQVTSSMVSGR